MEKVPQFIFGVNFYPSWASSAWGASYSPEGVCFSRPWISTWPPPSKSKPRWKMCGKYQCASTPFKKKPSIPVTVSYHIPSYPIICSTSILPWLPYTNHGSEQGANGRPVVQLGHPRSMRQGGSPNLGAAAMYWFHRCKSQKKRWWSLPLQSILKNFKTSLVFAVFLVNVSIFKKVCCFLILKSKICKPFRERSKNSTCKTSISTSGRLPGCPCHQLRDHFQPYHLGTTRAWISLQIPFVREDWSPVISIYLSIYLSI